ncbi:hypothetical protein DAEQUDRAFT_224728 [Daedalea quercina L-15889]|uniref:Uncharacterized protein n=1 Tax=Daedalea quercina L-15889 TaxID=1314783 RepID=A0A165QZ97_9APHY|nr:hypothetical protein DAEQUDRAFT_224728 [Daedalea quercina L-15889]
MTVVCLSRTSQLVVHAVNSLALCDLPSPVPLLSRSISNSNSSLWQKTFLLGPNRELNPGPRAARVITGSITGSTRSANHTTRPLGQQHVVVPAKGPLSCGLIAVNTPGISSTGFQAVSPVDPPSVPVRNCGYGPLLSPEPDHGRMDIIASLSNLHRAPWRRNVVVLVLNETNLADEM